MHESIVFYFAVRVRCRCEESSRSLSHLLVTFLFKKHSHLQIVICRPGDVAGVFQWVSVPLDCIAVLLIHYS